MNFTFPVPLPPNTHAICRFQKLLFVFVVSSAPITHRFCFNFERGPLLLEIPSVCRNLSPFRELNNCAGAEWCSPVDSLTRTIVPDVTPDTLTKSLAVRQHLCQRPGSVRLGT
jgi:hypothetical protein